MNNYNENRSFMKSSISNSDQISTADIAHGIPQPPLEKPIPEDPILIDLQPINSITAPKADFFECTSSRISRRAYSEKSMTTISTSVPSSKVTIILFP